MTTDDSARDGRPEDAEDEVDEGKESGPDSRDSEGDGEARDEREESQEGEQGERRPISVRDLMPSPSTRPSRRSPERGERRGREEDEGPGPHSAGGGAEEDAGADGGRGEGKKVEDSGESQPAASVPTPVRVAMDAPPPGDSRPPEALPSRRFEVDGEEWIVRISGRTITGTRPDPGALLMHLSFFRPEEPETPIRTLITVDRPLDALYEEDLGELLGRSRPAEREPTPSPDG